MPLLSVSDLTLHLNNRAIIENINFSVEKANILTIIGPSGSGKSSMLRCINRLYEPTAGQIMLNGQDINTLLPTDLRRKIGMIFQKTAVFDGTVAENLSYGPRLCGQNLAESELRELMNAVDLDEKLLERPASELSGGQEQRLSIARALANRPEVLLLDEPTSALDPATVNHVEQSLLRVRNEHGLTLIWVSHDIEQARRVADHVLLLEQGKVIRIDTVAAMLDEENGDKHALAFAHGQSSEDQT